jgi:hypothetical protein
MIGPILATASFIEEQFERPAVAYQALREGAMTVDVTIDEPRYHRAIGCVNQDGILRRIHSSSTDGENGLLLDQYIGRPRFAPPKVNETAVTNDCKGTCHVPLKQNAPRSSREVPYRDHAAQ